VELTPPSFIPEAFAPEASPRKAQGSKADIARNDRRERGIEVIPESYPAAAFIESKSFQPARGGADALVRPGEQCRLQFG
jgi:hypothetical protein